MAEQECYDEATCYWEHGFDAQSWQNTATYGDKAPRRLDMLVDAIGVRRVFALSYGLWLALLCSPDAAFAGRMQNPLPLYTAAGELVELRFDKTGATFQGMTHTFVGRKIYRATVDVETCAKGAVSRQVFELRFVQSSVHWTRKDYFGCEAAKRRLARTIRRNYHLTPPEAPRCIPQLRTFERQGQTITVREGCDGTVELSNGSGWKEVLSGRRGRYRSSGRVGAVRWKVVASRVTSREGEQGWRVRGRVLSTETGTQKIERYQGLYRLLPPKTVVPHTTK